MKNEKVTFEKLKKINDFLEYELENYSAIRYDFYYCPHEMQYTAWVMMGEKSIEVVFRFTEDLRLLIQMNDEGVEHIVENESSSVKYFWMLISPVIFSND